MKRVINYDAEQRAEIGRRAAEARAQGITLKEFITAEKEAGRPIDASFTTIFNWSVQYGTTVACERKSEPVRYFLSLVYFFLGFLLFVVNGTARKRRCAVKRLARYCKVKVLRERLSAQAVFNYQQIYRRKVEAVQVLAGMTRAVYDSVCEKLARFYRFLPRYPQVVYAVDATDLGIKVTDGARIGASYWFTIVIDVYSRLIVGWHLTIGTPDSIDSTITMWKSFRRKYTLTMVAFGRCWILQRDNNKQFDGILAEYLWQERVFSRKTTPGKPTTNPFVERAIRSFKILHDKEMEYLCRFLDQSMPGSWQNGTLALPPQLLLTGVEQAILGYNRHHHRILNASPMEVFNGGLKNCILRPFSDSDHPDPFHFSVTKNGSYWIENYKKLPGLTNALGGLRDEEITVRIIASDWNCMMEFTYKGHVLISYRKDFLIPNLDDDATSAWTEVNTSPRDKKYVMLSKIQKPCKISLP